MESYRLYFLNSSGRIRHAVEFQCATDDEALAAVELHRDGRPMEVWNLDRLVAAFTAARSEDIG